MAKASTEPAVSDAPEGGGAITGPTETVIIGDTRVTLLGTAHVSRTSAEEVASLLAGGDFDAVAVELCPSRYRTLTQPDAWGELDLFRVIREGRAHDQPAPIAGHCGGAPRQRCAGQLGKCSLTRLVVAER